MSETTRQLAAIMFTDIVGYTSMMGRDEEKAFEILRKNRELQKPLIEMHNGRWLKEIGDGILASFSSVLDAVHCAGDILGACEGEPDLKLRIGIHLGEVVFEDDDVFGDGVNVASRIQAEGDEVSITVSRSVYKEIKNKPGIQSESIGDRKLKNVDEAITLYKLKVEKSVAKESITPKISSEQPLIDAAHRRQTSSRRPVTWILLIVLFLIASYFIYEQIGRVGKPEITERSIAVLPFKNMSDKSSSQYFADGVMDAILNDLARISALKVIPGTSVEQYRKTTKSAIEIGNELDVAYLLTGSAQQYGEKVRITAKLIDARNDKQIWSENYDRERTEIFSTQSEIAEIVSRELQAKLTIKEKEILQSVPTSNLEAYDLYLRGKDYAKRYLNKLENQDYLSAHKLYYSSIYADPNFALAFTGLAEIYYERNYLKEFLEESPLDSVLLLCNLALAKDQNLEEAYAIRGKYFYYMENSSVKAYRDFEKALSLNPNFVSAMLELAEIYQNVRNFEESFKLLAKASSLVKGDDLIDLYNQFGVLYLHVSDFDKSRSFFEEAIRLQPDNVQAYHTLGHVNRCQARFQENMPIAEKLLEINPQGRGQYDAAIGFMMNGDFEKAEIYFRDLYSSSPDVISVHGYGDMHMYSYVLIKNGKGEEARQYLTEVRDFMLEAVAKNRSIKREIGYELAKVYSLLGETDEAIKWLENFYENGFFGGLDHFALYDPPFEPIRDDPRFIEILENARVQVAENRMKIKELEESLEMDQWLNR